MDVIDSIEAMRRARRQLPGTVGFVPTMGFLHRGHLDLMAAANRRADHLVVSIFVNPTQFGPGEDLDAYPRDAQGDRQQCADVGCQLLFMPTNAMMYADDHATEVSVDELGGRLCGRARPTHFAGVTTVVTKLFNIIEPDAAFFGRKDYQQLAVVRRMVRDLNVDVEIVGVPTARRDDGLAISSRNHYLDAQQRRDALCLSAALRQAWTAYQGGQRDGPRLVECARQTVVDAVGPAAIDYIECVDAHTLASVVDPAEPIGDDDAVVMAMAVQVGQARLIDNIRLDRPLPAALG